jgi:hypothetical protein
VSERPDKEWLSDGVTSNLPGELVFPLQSRELIERICGTWFATASHRRRPPRVHLGEVS